MNLSSVIFFVGVIIGTLAITYSAANRTGNTNEFYAAGNRLTGLQNGIAIAGDYMSAASFLGIAGTIALYGFDGFIYAIGFLVSYLIILFLIAEPLHNLGKYTLADAIAVRFESRLLRGLIASTTLFISIMYMLAQLVGAGALIHHLFQVEYGLAVMIVGFLMTIYVVFGGMVATSWVQIIKAVLLLSGTLILSLIILSRFHWSPSEMFHYVSTVTPFQERFLQPGNQLDDPWEAISLHLALILGTACLPHIVTRLFTVRDAITTRKSIYTATWIIGAFYVMTIFLGFGASAFVGYEELKRVGFGGNLTVTLLADALGGEFLKAYIAAVAFATILAVVTGLVLSASSAFAHDVYSHLVRRGMASEKEQIIIAKCSSVAVGIVSILLALGAQKMNVASLVGLTFAVAASANLPLFLLTLYWRRFTVQGAIFGMLTGLICSSVLVVIGPTVMNIQNGIIAREPIFPLANPGIISIPLGFLAAVICSYASKPAIGAEEHYDRVLFQALTGMSIAPAKKTEQESA
ncbi:cation acetate symporter [Brevibacillus sp. 179-C9.3 HS]|uniref:solute symporter family protein n=1 Tax=unclassified Brevibacillus TaxID=2684853 RepID=UPI0039A0FAF8